jgi:hypothetical protein
VYSNLSYRLEQASGIENHSLRYRLEIDAEVQNRPNVVTATLYVWPGQYGKSDPANARIFYSEFFKLDI